MFYDRLSKLYGTKISPQKSVAAQTDHSSHAFGQSKEHHSPEKKRLSQDDGVIKSSKRVKGSEQTRRERYLHEDYVSCLLMSKRVEAYDGPNGRATCHARCSFQCQHHFLSTANGAQFLREEMKKWWGLNVRNHERHTLLASDILTNCVKHEGKDTTARWFVGDKQVCRSFYLRARGMHHELLRKTEKKLLKEKQTIAGVVEDKFIKKEKEEAVSLGVRDWLSNYAKRFNEKSPTDGVSVLPFRNIKPVYEEYKRDFQTDLYLQAHRKTPLSRTQFGKWFNKLSNELNIRVTRDTGDFLSCTVCDAYDSRIRNARTEHQRNALMHFKRNHNAKQQKQRQKYYKHRRKASSDPQRFLSIIIDGMDQKKTNIPKMGRTVKDESPLTQRIVGVKVHGHGTFVYVCDDTVAKGGNLICDILRRTLNHLDSKGKLPHINPVLYLQIDNCGENKNKTLIAFLADLVRKKVFAKIKACFLMVGHTHDDIDQIFGTIATHIKQIHIFCPDRETLFSCIQDAFLKVQDKPTIFSVEATEVFDFTAFYKPFIDKKISYHQIPHQFRVKRFTTCSETSGEVVLVHYKNWAESAHWLPRVHTDPIPHDAGTGHSTKQSAKGQLTRGQRGEKIKSGNFNTTKQIGSMNDINENDEYHTDDERADLEQAAEHMNGSTFQLRGILWLQQETSFDRFPLVQFTPQQLAANYNSACKIYQDVCDKFASKYQEIFGPSVMQHWDMWLEAQKQCWDPTSKRFTYKNMAIPAPFSMRVVSVDDCDAIMVADSAPAEFADTVEYVSNDSGKFGCLTKQQQRQALAIRGLGNLDCESEENAVETILENMACIFTFKYPHLQSKTTVEQIGVGIITKVHGDPADKHCSVDIQFCPEKGAKCQTSKRPDTLYQNIQASMSFNTRYKIKKNKLRVPDISPNQPREVLLAWNLDLTAQGTFGLEPRVGDHGNNFTSLQFAQSVISEYYESKKKA
jgi:hypothetical protein